GVGYNAAGVVVPKLALGRRSIGVVAGARVATPAYNSDRHFALYYAISGMGAVCHTINPRLPLSQMKYIVEHAEDRVLFFDPGFEPLVAELAAALPNPPRLIAMCDADAVPPSALQLGSYGALLRGQPAVFDWPELSERAAAGLCYTSGTTGDPKGALYSHRSTVLHALVLCAGLPQTLREGQRILPVVPLFHVNAWGLPYTAPLSGASLVMPGKHLDGESLFDLMDKERVTSAWGVPTVWLGLLSEIDRRGRIPDGFEDVVIGGSAAPAPMIDRFERLGVNVCHAWGMTELSPVGTQANLPMRYQAAPHEKQVAKKARQGRRLFGVELKIVDEDGARLPHDGVAVGALHARGNTVINGYYHDPDASQRAMDSEGWFGTGDIASIDPDGFLMIADRMKDVIKSGGEWISSIDLENATLAHPGVANCAVIAVPDDKWGERPLLVVVPTGTPPEKADILKVLGGSFAKWQLPDEVVFVDALPLTATGKVSKRMLRERFPAMPKSPSVSA
ncbi:MAG: long-chain fatty acid--CoA ligase, partial [Pseudomonadota bacterium]